MVGGESGRFCRAAGHWAGPARVDHSAFSWLMIGGLLASAALFFTLKEDGPPDQGSERSRDHMAADAARKRKSGGNPDRIHYRARLYECGVGDLFAHPSARPGRELLAGECVAFSFAGCGRSGRNGWRHAKRSARTAVDVVRCRVAHFDLYVCLPGGDQLGAVSVLLILGFTSLSITPVMMALVQESFPQNGRAGERLLHGLELFNPLADRSGCWLAGRFVRAAPGVYGQRCRTAAGAALLLLLPPSAHHRQRPDSETGRVCMVEIVIRRVLLMLLTMLIVSIVVFFVSEVVPMDPARNFLGQFATAETIAAFKEQLASTVRLQRVTSSG